MPGINAETECDDGHTNEGNTQGLGNQSFLEMAFSIIPLRATLASLIPQVELHRQPLVPVTTEALRKSDGDVTLTTQTGSKVWPFQESLKTSTRHHLRGTLLVSAALSPSTSTARVHMYYSFSN